MHYAHVRFRIKMSLLEPAHVSGKKIDPVTVVPTQVRFDEAPRDYCGVRTADTGDNEHLFRPSLQLFGSNRSRV
jgi:hypothetical protein